MIKVAIAGVGNCASSLVQGVHYYRNVDGNHETVPGLMHNLIGPYKISDVNFVAAFDVDARKVNKRLSDAIFAPPNNTLKLCDVPKSDTIVRMGPVHDGIADHMHSYDEDKTFVLSDEEPVDVVEVLKESGAEILLNYLPVGSQKATEYYVEACLETGVALINCIPVFIASNKTWESRFSKRNIPLIGDDIKSQIGATIIHRTLARLFSQRGVILERSYQLNTGGNTDFLNMLERKRLASKRLSKTEAVTSQLSHDIHPDMIHIGPSDYVAWQKDNKLCFLRMEGRKFGGAPVKIDLKLSVEDSPNSAGCVIDAIRCCKLALDRSIGGALTSVSAYLMKRPPMQYPDEDARKRVEAFIAGEIER